jgi:putative oxidoreductase
MTFPQLAQFQDLALLFLRLMVGAVFVTSGWRHVTNPVERSKDIGMSKAFTLFLGVAELTGGLGVATGVLAQLAALGLILVMMGAMQKKIFVWHTGFWGKSGTNGWSYELMMIIMCLVVATTGGGAQSLQRMWIR